jgi:hypothetical protein
MQRILADEVKPSLMPKAVAALSKYRQPTSVNVDQRGSTSEIL